VFLLLFNISEGELFLVVLVALLLFGSKGLPGLLRTFGRGIQQVRQASDSVKQELRKTMYEAELEIKRRKFEIENSLPISDSPDTSNQNDREKKNEDSSQRVKK